jgi:hypothetical protein
LDDLKTVYEKLLEIGTDNSLTASENVCLQSLVDEVGGMFPDPDEYEPDPEDEIGMYWGEEM